MTAPDPFAPPGAAPTATGEGQRFWLVATAVVGAGLAFIVGLVFLALPVAPQTASVTQQAGQTVTLPPAPAGSVPQAAEPVPMDPTAGCLHQSQGVSSAPAARQDPAALAGANELPEPPVPGSGPVKVQGSIPIRTPQDYVNQAVIANPQARVAVLLRDGLDGGVMVNESRGADDYGVDVLRFASPSAAVDYFHAHMADVCELVGQSFRLPHQAGVAYLRTDGIAKAVFVVGRSEVDLDICTCVEVGDHLTLAGQWAQLVATRLERG